MAARKSPFVVNRDFSTLTLVPLDGFLFGAVEAAVKAPGRLDVAMVFSGSPWLATAGVFTTNKVRASAVDLSEQRIKQNVVRALLVNSGNANACTGKAGRKDAEALTAALANELLIGAGEVAPASTGVIGKPLPVERMRAAVPKLIEALSEDGIGRDGIEDFAKAILTTDKGPKVASLSFKTPQGNVQLVGVAKGAGMIHPNMATTLGFVFTNARLSKAMLSRSLKRCADGTFNTISVDGDTSTNDSLYCMASGVGPAISKTLLPKFEQALTAILGALAEQIVADGEGSQHLVRLTVKGGIDRSRDLAGRAVSNSLLVKTALHGRDANWGRIAAAVGRSGADFDPRKLKISIAGVEVYKNEMPVGADAEAKAQANMCEASYSIEITLGPGKEVSEFLMCDLGHEYIDVNATYRS